MSWQRAVPRWKALGEWGIMFCEKSFFCLCSFSRSSTMWKMHVTLMLITNRPPSLRKYWHQQCRYYDHIFPIKKTVYKNMHYSVSSLHFTEMYWKMPEIANQAEKNIMGETCRFRRFLTEFDFLVKYFIFSRTCFFVGKPVVW